MLMALRKGLGFRLAACLALLAAACFMAPPAVMAQGHGTMTLHCLTHADEFGHSPQAGDADHQHGDHAKLPAKQVPACCGLFCMSALTPAASADIERQPAQALLESQGSKPLTSRVPDGPDRPPITLSLSV